MERLRADVPSSRSEETTGESHQALGELAVVSIAPMLRSISKGVWLVVLCTTLGIILALVAARQMTHVYVATMVVRPAEDTLVDSGSQREGSAFLDLAGINTGPEKNEGLFLHLLTDPLLIEWLDRESEFIKFLYRDMWDETQQRWRNPTGLLPLVKRVVRHLAGMPVIWSPEPGMAANEIGDALSIERNKDNGVYIISLHDPSPKRAEIILQRLFDGAEAILRSKAKEKSEARLQYLRAKLSETNVIEHQRVLQGLLAQEERKMMLINLNEGVAVELLSPPRASALPNKPKLTLMLVLGIVFGLGVGTLLALWKYRN